jgi:mannose-6-phosphate isomerase-like protein (cupin superfamily)
VNPRIKEWNVINMTQLLKFLKKAVEEVVLYQELLKPSAEEIRIGFAITDTEESATLILRKTPHLSTGLQNPDCKITMNSETLEQIAHYEKDAFALVSRARMDEARPINFEFMDQEKAPLAIETIKRLGTYFLLPGKIKMRRIQLRFAGEAHGAQPIPLAYWEDFRSAWYFIQPGQILNEEGEKDPWPQLFIPISGKGKVIIDKSVFEIQPKTAIYIPPNTIHQIQAEELVELIWMAWNAPM